MSHRMLRLIILAIIIITHTIAFFQFQLQSVSMPLPPEWKGQFCFLLTISFVMGILLSFCQKRIVIWQILFFRSIILLVVGLPLGGYMGVKLTLLIPLIIEAIEYTTLWSGVLFSLGIVGLMIGIQFKPIVAWGHFLPVASTHDLWSFGTYAGFVIILGIILRYQRDNQVPAMEINRRFHEATLQLAQVNMQLQEYAVTAEQEAIISERKRLARDIHDTLGYTLTNLVMMIEAAKDLTRKEPALLEHLERTRSQAKEGLAEVRQALQALRPIELTTATGLTAIHHLITTFAKATQIEVELDLGNAPLNFGDDADLVAYRLVQEGITNALRHGRATKISVSFTLIKEGVSIFIKDNGIGASGTQEGYGLIGMRERIERLGGKLETSTSGKSGEGFRLLAWIPIQKGV